MCEMESMQCLGSNKTLGDRTLWHYLKSLLQPLPTSQPCLEPTAAEFCTILNNLVDFRSQTRFDYFWFQQQPTSFLSQEQSFDAKASFSLIRGSKNTSSLFFILFRSCQPGCKLYELASLKKR